MKFNRIKNMLLHLSPEEKIVGIGAIVVLIGTFLPWYSVISSINKTNTTVSGFSGDLGVIGFVTFLITAIALTFLIANNFSIRLPNFGFKKEQITLFLMGESAFLLLLTIAIYTKRSFDYTNAEIRFGLYLSLIGAVIATFAAFAQTQKQQKKEVEAFFSHPEEEKETESINEYIKEKDTHEPINEIKKTKPGVKPTQKVEQKSFFYEEADVPNPANKKDKVLPKESEEKIIDQGSYFKKEAGVQETKEVKEAKEVKNEPNIKVDMESIKPAEKKEPINKNKSFYDDF